MRSDRVAWPSQRRGAEDRLVFLRLGGLLDPFLGDNQHHAAYIETSVLLSLSKSRHFTCNMTTTAAAAATTITMTATTTVTTAAST